MNFCSLSLRWSNLGLVLKKHCRKIWGIKLPLARQGKMLLDASISSCTKAEKCREYFCMHPGCSGRLMRQCHRFSVHCRLRAADGRMGAGNDKQRGRGAAQIRGDFSPLSFLQLPAMAPLWCECWASALRSGPCWRDSQVVWQTWLLLISTPTSWRAWMRLATSLSGAWPWRKTKSSILSKQASSRWWGNG